MQMKGMKADNYDYFTYVSLYSPVRTVYYRFVFKSYEPVEGLDEIVNSFQRIPAKGLAVYNKEYHVQIPEDWTEETRELYERMRGSQEFEFGIFQGQLEAAGYNTLSRHLKSAPITLCPLLPSTCISAATAVR